MIKNLLYSLFLHFVLLLIIYANFNLKEFDESNKTSEIAVSLVALDGDENSNSQTPSVPEKIEEKEVEKPVEKPVKKEVAKEAKSEKKAPKKTEVKEKPKKLAQLKPAKAIKKPVVEEKIAEFKQVEKEETKQEESPKVKEDKTANENQDDEQNKVTKKEKDLGAEKISDKEQEEKKEQEAQQNDAADLANNIENMDLSVREKFNIQSQLKRCYRRAIEETKLTSKIKVMVKVKISEEGYIDSDIDEMVDVARYKDPKELGYKIVIDNVKRAIDLCSPLRNLPLDKYDVWKEAVLEFDDE